MSFANQTPSELLIKFNPNDFKSKTSNESTHFGIAVDISTSMGAYTEFINDSGEKEKADTNYLDLVKHCIKVIIESLSEYESYILSLVVFNEAAYPIIVSKKITNETKHEIFENIMNLKHHGRTNICEPIQLLINILNESDDNLAKKIILFTDGISNVNPPRGVNHEINKLIQYYSVNIPVHILGFGYQLDIKCLTDICNITNGSYSYIPSTGELLTVMIHLITRLIIESCKEEKCTIKFDNATDEDMFEITKYLNKSNITIEKNKVIIDVGGISSPRTYLLNCTSENKPKVHHYLIKNGVENSNEHISYEIPVENVPPTDESKLVSIRNKFIQLLNKMYQNAFIDRISKNNEIYKECLNLLDKDISQLREYEKDLTGEIKLALLYCVNFQKWGVYYIPSLINAYTNNTCNSFRDYGIQEFLTNDFKEIRNKLNDLFDKLQPPVASSPRVASYNINYNTNYNTGCTTVPQTATLQRTVTMRQYEGGGCFGGDCLISTPNGFIEISELQKGDKVLNHHNGISTVECIVRFKTNQNATDVCIIDNKLIITPWHPVFMKNSWTFPNQVVETTQMNCDYVYNIVLNDRKCVLIGGIICCTLGHGINGHVISHRFFGTEEVIKNLKRKFENEYDVGLVKSITGIVRDNNNLVIGYK